jgi:hypothetical protein
VGRLAETTEGTQDRVRTTVLTAKYHVHAKLTDVDRLVTDGMLPSTVTSRFEKNPESIVTHFGPIDEPALRRTCKKSLKKLVFRLSLSAPSSKKTCYYHIYHRIIRPGPLGMLFICSRITEKARS